MEAKVAWVDPTADPALYLYGADPVAKLAAEQAPVCIFYREDLIAAVSIEAIKAEQDAALFYIIGSKSSSRTR